jgi:hypothetical protein
MGVHNGRLPLLKPLQGKALWSLRSIYLATDALTIQKGHRVTVAFLYGLGQANS